LIREKRLNRKRYCWIKSWKRKINGFVNRLPNMRKDKEMPIGKIMWWVLIITSIEMINEVIC